MNPQSNTSTNDDEDVRSVNLKTTVRQASQQPIPVSPDLIVGAPAFAGDTDLIEKEWVDKAKQIVEKTKYNPHDQQKALSRFRADYMKKRYNKDIKEPDS